MLRTVSEQRIEVSRWIAAEPATVFDVLRDPHGHVAIDSSGMLMDASGEPVEAVGDRFTVHMDREALGDRPLGRYDVDVVITVYEPDVEIAWTVEGQVRPYIGHVYGYRLEPDEDGTRVTSYYDWSDIHAEWAARDIFPVINPHSLKATLGILARTVQKD
ncbi:SRPBCC family protein [Actinomycetospora rhizophila]|uniref:SRPBCC family protein n=1 Tax=Actinomycetospora rhizophila TaxID=1416876 RepID=UPI0036710EFD